MSYVYAGCCGWFFLKCSFVGSEISFPVMPRFARTLWMWIVSGAQYICFTIFAISNLFGW